ncbi:MAG: hypothetical protein K0S29_1257 [Gammaproteobacteria bacterium]|jgi:hypothetical protein|nr:hypothetical protein [Gammaproteobacteria bacterium]
MPIQTLASAKLNSELEKVINNYIEAQSSGVCLPYFRKAGVERAGRLKSNLVMQPSSYQGIEDAMLHNSESMSDSGQIMGALQAFDWGSSKLLKQNVINCIVELHFKSAEIQAKKTSLAQKRTDSEVFTKTTYIGDQFGAVAYTEVLDGEELELAKKEYYNSMLVSEKFKQAVYAELYDEAIKAYPVMSSLRVVQSSIAPGLCF